MGISDSIIGAESGGNPNATNPNSSAAGPGQFIDSTWLNMVGKYRPDLAGSMSSDDLLALKTNPAIAKQMTDAYANENAGILKQNGFEASPGNVYLAHFAGPAGATNVLGSDPGTPIEKVLGQGVVAANPFLRGMTAGDVTNWAAKKMGGASPVTASASPIAAPQSPAGSPPGLLAPTPPAPDAAPLQGLLAQKQPGQPQATQNPSDGGGLLQPMGLLSPQRQAAHPFQLGLKKRIA